MDNAVSQRTLHDYLEFIINNFPAVKEGNKIKGAPKPQELVNLSDRLFRSMKDFMELLNQRINERLGEDIDLGANYGRGQGNWPEVTWIYFGLDGYYNWNGSRISLPLNFQFDDKIGGIFLTMLGHGKQLIDIFGDEWKSKVDEIRSNIQVNLEGEDIGRFSFNKLNADHLRSGSDAQIMRLSYFLHRFYPANNIPNDDEIIEDALTLLFAQDHLFEEDRNDSISSENVHLESMDEIMDPKNKLLLKKKQIILFGPPGTGKTYITRDLAISILKGD